MRRRFFSSFEDVLAVGSLLLIALGAAIAGWYGGAGAAGLITLMLVLVLDGPNQLWHVLTRAGSARRDEAVRAALQDRASEGSKDNPTVR